jgi:hypothetical protein
MNKMFNENECKCCHKVFASHSNLKKHERRNQCGGELEPTSCTFCGVNYKILSKHVCKKKMTAIENMKEELDEKENQIRLLNTKTLLLEQELSIFKKMFEEKDSVVTKLALQPKMSTNTNTTNTTTTTMYNNLSVFDVEEITRRLEEKMETVEYSDLLEGQKSLAKIVGPCLKNEDGKSMYICSDPSRFVFCTKNSSGEILRDQGGTKILNLTNGIVVPKAKDKLYSELRIIYAKPNMKVLKQELIELEEKIKSREGTLKGMNERQKDYGEFVRYLKVLKEDYEERMREYINYEREGYKEEDDYCDEETNITESVVDIDDVVKNSKGFLKCLIQV